MDCVKRVGGRDPGIGSQKNGQTALDFLFYDIIVDLGIVNRAQK